MTRSSSWNLEWFCLKKTYNLKNEQNSQNCFVLNEISLFEVTIKRTSYFLELSYHNSVKKPQHVEFLA